MIESIVESIMKCNDCHGRRIVHDRHLEILYKDIEKNLKDIILNLCSGSYSKDPWYQGVCREIEIHKSTLEKILDIDVRKV